MIWSLSGPAALASPATPTANSPARSQLPRTRLMEPPCDGNARIRRDSLCLRVGRPSSRKNSPAAAVIPHHPGLGRVAEHLDGAALVDVPDEPAVDAVAAELAEARREAARDFARDAELLVLLLADPSRAVVHRDPDAPDGRPVGAAP